MIGPLFDMFTGAMFIFSSVKFLNMCKPRTGRPTSIEFLWKLASKTSELAGMVNVMWLRPIRSELFLQMIQGFLIKQAVFLPEQPAP